MTETALIPKSSISNFQAIRRGPEPMHAALNIALSSATIALETGSLTAESLPSGPRTGLAQRKATLASMLRPCHADRIRAILVTLLGMPAKAEADPSKARFMAAQDVADLEDACVPEFALDQAARAFRLNSVPGKGQWRPTIGELRVEGSRIAQPFFEEHAKIARVLAALDSPRLPPSARRPVSPEAWAALKSSIGNLGKAATNGQA